MPEIAEQCLLQGISTVDSYDIHADIWEQRARLDAAAKKGGSTAVIATGIDPGCDSLVRVLLEAMAPRGVTFTNFGPGMSMGHTVAARGVAGVKNALSLTIPVGAGVHRRMVYIELEAGYAFDEVVAKIKADPYFSSNETHVMLSDDVEALKDVGHSFNIVRRGGVGRVHNQLFEFNMKGNNPALTTQAMVACARAGAKQAPGAYTLIELPVIDLLEGSREDVVRRMV